MIVILFSMVGYFVNAQYSKRLPLDAFPKFNKPWGPGANGYTTAFEALQFALEQKIPLPTIKDAYYDSLFFRLTTIDNLSAVDDANTPFQERVTICSQFIEPVEKIFQLFSDVKLKAEALVLHQFNLELTHRLKSITIEWLATYSYRKLNRVREDMMKGDLYYGFFDRTLDQINCQMNDHIPIERLISLSRTSIATLPEFMDWMNYGQQVMCVDKIGRISRSHYSEEVRELLETLLKKTNSMQIASLPVFAISEFSTITAINFKNTFLQMELNIPDQWQVANLKEFEKTALQVNTKLGGALGMVTEEEAELCTYLLLLKQKQKQSQLPSLLIAIEDVGPYTNCKAYLNEIKKMFVQIGLSSIGDISYGSINGFDSYTLSSKKGETLQECTAFSFGRRYVLTITISYSDALEKVELQNILKSIKRLK